MLENFMKHFSKFLILILLVCLFSVSSLYIDLYRRFEVQRNIIGRQEEDIRFLRSQLDDITPLLEILNMSRRPKTYYDKGIELVSGYNINYEKINERYDFDFFILFYAPLDNLTLKMDLFFWPWDGPKIPLTNQKGDALRNESGFLVERTDGERSGSPPSSGSMNASRAGSYGAPLPSKGWCTPCITGPIKLAEPEDSSSFV
jgi:hypothetical protein